MQNNYSKEKINNIIEPNKETRNFITYCLVIVMFFFCWSLADSYFFINVEVVGASMENTLYGGDSLKGERGDVLYVDIRSEAKIGDIIVIDHKLKQNGKYEYIIKRVIGKEGDTITIKNGSVYRNGTALDETAYIKRYSDGSYAKTSATSGTDLSAERTWVLNEGEYFFLGDNRENSSDSRYYGVAKESENDIVGVVPDWSVKYKKIITNKTNLFESLRKAVFGK